MGSLYHSSCKAVDETIELFTDMKPRGMAESCSKKISKGRHVDSNLTRWSLIEIYVKFYVLGSLKPNCTGILRETEDV